MLRTATEVRQLAEESNVRIVDLKSVDLPGIWQHFSIPMPIVNSVRIEELDGVA